MRCVVTRCRSRSWLRTRGRRQQQYGRFRLYGQYVSLWICINLLHDAKFYECKFAIWLQKYYKNLTYANFRSTFSPFSLFYGLTRNVIHLTIAQDVDMVIDDEFLYARNL